MEKLIVDLSRASKKRADVDGKGFVGLTLMHSHLKMGIIFFFFLFFSANLNFPSQSTRSLVKVNKLTNLTD